MAGKKKNKEKLHPGVHGKGFKLFLVIAVVLMIVPFALDVVNGTYKPVDTEAAKAENFVVVVDEADLLSAEEEEQLRKTMEGFLPYGSAALYTTDYNSYGDTDRLADEKYVELIGDYYNQAGSLLVIDMDNRYLVLSNGGSVERKISSRDSDEITSNIYRHASSGDYFRCAQVCFEQATNLLRDMAIPRTMKHISNLLVSLGISVCAVFLFALLKTKMKEYTPESLFDKTVEKKVELELQEAPRLIDRKKSIHIEASSGGGGGRSGGGGGRSGGGGGGGHSSGGHGF